jgi:hypothetical protein
MAISQSSTFDPPGPGEWRIIDHITFPGTHSFAGYYYQPMEAGWNIEARQIGAGNPFQGMKISSPYVIAWSYHSR